MYGLRIVCVAVTLGWSSAAVAGALYRFVDERGVVHFSDVRSDPRYAPVRGIFRFRPSPPSLRLYDPLIADQARRHGVPPGLVKAVIAAESSFNPRAVSAKGAQGLMQLMPGTARALGVEDPFEVDENVSGGARYLRRLIDRYRDLSHALAAYNAGPEAVDRYRGIPPYPETREYVERVLAYYRRYDADFAR